MRTSPGRHALLEYSSRAFSFSLPHDFLYFSYVVLCMLNMVQNMRSSVSEKENSVQESRPQTSVSVKLSYNVLVMYHERWAFILKT